MSEEAKGRKFENEEPGQDAEDVEAHYKGGKLANDEAAAAERDYKGGKLANDEGDGDDDVEAHFKAGKTL
jgi:hypothetical protein